MGNDTQNNDEQFELLLMTLEDVKHGICLFQSKQQTKWITLLQERLGKEKIIVHNIAEDDENNGMVTSKDFRKWALQSDARVVVVYNVQLLGLRFGDEEAIEKLNFMRDQILAIGKLFVLGVSPYFDLLLSRKARDLYSCILYHFIFQDSEERVASIRDMGMNELSGDDTLEIERYKELKERILNSKEKADISLYLSCMESWNNIREYLSYEENEFVETLAVEADKQYRQKKIELSDIENIEVLAKTWLELEEREKSVFWYEKALCIVREESGEEHEMYADALVAYSDYYGVIGDYNKCERCYDRAINIYNKKNMRYSENGRAILQRKAGIYRKQSKFDEALNIYMELLDYQTNKFGEKYYGNAIIYNNIGKVYEGKGNFEGAIEQYNKALDLLNCFGKQGGSSWKIYQNISHIYLKNGDGISAWKYIKKAKSIAEDVYGKDSINFISIYNSMSGVWQVRSRMDKAVEYLQEALKVIQRTNMEDSEAASYVYHNMGCFLVGENKIDLAVSYLNHAIKIQLKVFGERNEIVASSYEQLAYAFYKMPDYEECRKYIDKARNIYLSLYGSQDENVKRIDNYLKSKKKVF